MNQEKYLTNDFIILRENDSIASRIAAMHYSYFESTESLSAELIERREQIQCLISDRAIEGQVAYFDFGKAQEPGSMDYADGIDTVIFLAAL